MNLYRIYFYLVCFSSPICWWVDKKEKTIERVYTCMFISVYAYMFSILFMHFYWRSLCLCCAWVKGEFLWSLSLIHTYITPWVLSSSKRGRLLSQRLITLVLMMINSSSYSTNDLVFIKFYIFNQDLSRCFASIKNS